MDLLTTALAKARTQIGVMEDPPGSNAGYSVEQYLKSVGLGKGFSWCMAFVYWCYRKAAAELQVNNPLIRTAGVMDHWNRAPKSVRIPVAEAKKNPAILHPGVIGILLLDRHTSAGHTFLLESATDGRLKTVEGNTNQGLSREGIGVFELDRRKLSDQILVGFLDYSRI